ncbi:hypothetical protein D1831_10670 [Lactiplantibacillus garii]|uniref:DUF2187 domain-containing protein n=1 Tax=Lactiplantibacillus garii TaxID=2306423 RepID=A0A426D5I8_9LACO|nr:hypothetical protein [Lactiplantibacillus garii]RRK09828.1 hypothetical protein D1831_10670 [Lactiplantibacillus garii]
MHGEEIGTQVHFKLEGQPHVGTIAKAYTNAYLIEFESTDPEIVDKYHNKVIISQKQVQAVK